MDERTGFSRAFILDNVLWSYPAYIDAIKFAGGGKGMHGFVYRKDWAKQVGKYKDSGLYTWAEFLDMIKTVVDQDCAGAGKTIGLAGTDYTMPRFWGGGGYSPYFMGYAPDGEGGYTWAPSLPGSLDAVKLMNSMYKDKIIWQDQYMAFPEDVDTNFYGQMSFAGIMENMGPSAMDGMVNSFTNNVELGAADPKGAALEMIDFGVFEGPDGMILSYQPVDCWSQSAMKASITDTVAYRWQNILDYLVTEEGYLFRNMGIKGKDWDYGDDGRPHDMWTNIDAVTGEKKPPQDGYNWWTWARAASSHDDFRILFGEGTVDPRIQAIIDRTVGIYQRENVRVIPQLLEIASFDGEMFSRTGTREKQTIAQMSKMLLSDNVEQEWNNWVASQLPIFQDAIDELNAAFKK
jgi:hypothetical protein